MKALMRVVFTILIGLSALPIPGGALAEDSANSLESILTGAVIDVGSAPDAVFDLENHKAFETDTGYFQERIFIDFPTGVVTVNITLGDINPRKWHDESLEYVPGYYDHYVDVLGQGVTEEQSWIVTRGIRRSVHPDYIYEQFDVQMVDGVTAAVGAHGSESNILKNIKWVQDNLTINGQAIYEDVDLDEIQSMIDGTSAEEPIRLYGFDSDLSDWSEHGLKSETEWQIPVLDHEITWDGSDLVFDFHDPDAIHHSTDSSGNYVRLVSTASPGMVGVSVFPFPGNLDGQAAGDFLEDRYTSEEWLAQAGGMYPVIGSTKTETAAQVAYSSLTYYGDTSIFIRLAWHTPEGNVVFINVSSDVENIAGAWESTIGSLVINGESVESIWTQAEIEEMFPPVNSSNSIEIDAGSDDGSSDKSIRTSRSDATAEPTEDAEATAESSVRTTRSSTPEAISEPSDNSMTSTQSGVTVDLGPSGEAVFRGEVQYSTVSGSYKLDTFKIDYGSTLIILVVMDGDIPVDEYMLAAERDIAAPWDQTDWLGGDWTGTPAWDLYSGAYWLNYRETAYLDLVQDPESGLYYSIGVYGKDTDIVNDIKWLQANVTIDGKGILAATDTEVIESVLNGSSDYAQETVPEPTTTVEVWEAAGLVSETEWQSPVGDLSITWDGTNVVFPFARTAPITVEDDMAVLELLTSDGSGEIVIFSSIRSITPSEWIEHYTSDEYLTSQAEAGLPTTILDSYETENSGGVIMTFETSLGDPIVMIRGMVLNADGTVTSLIIYAAPEDVIQVYSLIQENVRTQGEQLPVNWTVEQIEALDID